MTTATIAELTADAKQVYKVGAGSLIALADKYGATTRSLTYWRANPDGRPLAVAACASKSQLQELQRAVYAAIKRQIAEAENA